jgi:hypothetical protein
MAEVAFVLARQDGGYRRRRDGKLFLYVTREEAELGAYREDTVMPVYISDIGVMLPRPVVEDYRVRT